MAREKGKTHPSDVIGWTPSDRGERRQGGLGQDDETERPESERPPAAPDRSACQKDPDEARFEGGLQETEPVEEGMIARVGYRWLAKKAPVAGDERSGTEPTVEDASIQRVELTGAGEPRRSPLTELSDR